MAKIKVDCGQFEKAAKAIDDYLQLMKEKMNEAQSQINGLSSGWQGADFAQFNSKWNSITNGDSTYAKARKALESYAEYLRYASQKYKETQDDAIARANKLPK